MSGTGTRYISHLNISSLRRNRNGRRTTTLNVSTDELRDKSLDEALVYIAERNEGVVPSTAAREVLIAAGVLKGSQVGNRLWAALDRSERFEREAKGRYRLVTEEGDVPF